MVEDSRLQYKDKQVAQYINDNTLGQFSFSNGFDPYNIQIESVGFTGKYMKTNANGAGLQEGSIIGSYPTDPGTVTMGNNTPTITPNPKWYDERDLFVTNATFMAVQDDDGNMQLMPRFDHATSNERVWRTYCSYEFRCCQDLYQTVSSSGV